MHEQFQHSHKCKLAPSTTATCQTAFWKPAVPEGRRSRRSGRPTSYEQEERVVWHTVRQIAEQDETTPAST